MAAVAGNALRRMARMDEALRHFIFEVTAHAAIGILLRRAAKTEDQFIGLCCLFFIALRCLLGIDVSLSGTVTVFAGHGGLAGGRNVRVIRFAEFRYFRFMARAAGVG